MYEAKDPNLSRFFAHGGKLLVWHGESDPGPSPAGTLDYARAVMAQEPRAPRSIPRVPRPRRRPLRRRPRRRRAAGCRHDRRLGPHRQPAPESVVATKRDKSLTRLDCAWPKVAHYEGGGDPNDPSSWNCVAEGGPASHPGERG